MVFKKLSPWILAAALLVPLLGATVFWASRGNVVHEFSDEPLFVARRDSEVSVGGVSRPRTDTELPVEAREVLLDARRFQNESLSRGSILGREKEYGALDESMNPNVASVIEAIRTRTHPERLSPVILPPLFDSQAFENDPQAYLDVVEPGRVFQSAQPGPGVRAISVKGNRRHEIRQLESVRLSVKAPSGYPITFTSMDLGQFENHLTSITVLASDDGVASAAFTGTAGTTDEVAILAAGPMTSGRVEFVITILE